MDSGKTAAAYSTAADCPTMCMISAAASKQCTRAMPGNTAHSTLVTISLRYDSHLRHVVRQTCDKGKMS